jgi:hypothetical protein
VIIRLTLIAGIPVGRLQSQFGFKDWAHTVKKIAGNHYVVMTEGFQNPSKYDYYNNTLKGFDYDARDYRSTQFDIWPIEDSIQHQRVLYMSGYKLPGLLDSIKVSAGTWYYAWVNDFRTYQQVTIDNGIYKMSLPAGQQKIFALTITNPYSYTVNFSNTGWQHKVYMEACFFDKTGHMEVQMADSTTFNKIILKPGQSVHYSFPIVSPKQKGRYDLLFSIRTDPFKGSKNSRIVKFTAE